VRYDQKCIFFLFYFFFFLFLFFFYFFLFFLLFFLFFFLFFAFFLLFSFLFLFLLFFIFFLFSVLFLFFLFFPFVVFFFLFLFFFFLVFFYGPVSLRSGCTTALGVLYTPTYSIQPRFNNPVPRMKRQRSVTEAVLMFFGSTISFPKTL